MSGPNHASGRQHASGARAPAPSGAVKSVSYATSPLLASPTPPWRSRFVVAMVAIGFAVLFGRAVWLQILHTDFYQAQGEKRFVVTQPLPASQPGQSHGQRQQAARGARPHKAGGGGRARRVRLLRGKALQACALRAARRARQRCAAARACRAAARVGAAAGPGRSGAT
jgi:hypothetical protein